MSPLYLIDLGANVNAQTDHDEETALLLAARKGNIELVRLLLDYNADPDHRNVNGLTALNLSYSLGFFDIASVLMQSSSSQQVSPTMSV
jgi:ankyrin repeat protein